jgi:predicted PurR-regulated permease PerM
MPSILKRESDGSVVELTVSSRTIVRIVLIILAMAVIAWGVIAANHAIFLIFISFFLALALNAPVHYISKHLPGKLRGSRSLATTISYLIVIIIISSFVAYIAPPLIHQTESFIKSSPKIIDEFKNQSGAVGSFIRHYHLQNTVKTISSQLSSRVNNISGKALPALIDIGKSIFSLLAIIVMTFMMLVEGPRWVNAFKRIIPQKHNELSSRLAFDMYRVIRGYVNGQVLLAGIAAVFIAPALFMLHVSYPIALIVVVFICGLIPMVGHTIGAVIITIVALFHSITSGAIILVYYILYIQLENYLIQPKLQSNTTRMSPLLVFSSLIIGLDFGGLLGGLIAIPVAGCLRVAILEFLRTKNAISTPEFEKALSSGHSSSSTEDR